MDAATGSSFACAHICRCTEQQTTTWTLTISCQYEGIAHRRHDSEGAIVHVDEEAHVQAELAQHGQEDIRPKDGRVRPLL